MIMALVPSVTSAVAAVLFVVPHVAGLVMSNDMMQPATNGQPMGTPVTAFPVTLRNIRSVVPFRNSVIGEQVPSAVVSAGPRTGVPITPAVIGICHSALTKPLVPHAYKFPVPPEE